VSAQHPWGQRRLDRDTPFCANISALAIRGAAAAQISSPRARQTGVLHRTARGNDFVVD
jgi:hypothetical protein